jgi:hypothetical protein
MELSHAGLFGNATMIAETELQISRVGFPPFSARNCQQQLIAIRSGDFHRTVNGRLCYFGRDTHHKFQSVIVCEDQSAFAFDQFWCGVEVDVSCIQRLWQNVTVSQAGVQLMRPAVAETVLVRDLNHKALSFRQTAPSSLTINASESSKALIGFCPQLKMRVTHFRFTTHEWTGKSSWALELEEI